MELQLEERWKSDPYLKRGGCLKTGVVYTGMHRTSQEGEALIFWGILEGFLEKACLELGPEGNWG